MSRIRILHCIETISSGGVERIRLTFAKRLDYSRYELKIICTQAAGVIRKELEELGVEIIQLGPFKSPFEWTKYRQVLNVISRYRPHIIHGAVFEGMSMAAIAGTLGRVPIRILEETSEPIRRSRRALLLQRFLLRFCHKIIGISPSVVGFLKHEAYFPTKKIHLINNGVEVPRQSSQKERNEIRKRLGIKHTDLLIGSVGRIYDQVKRFSDIFHAVKLLNSTHVKFLLIGNGPDLYHLKSKAIEMGLDQQILFIGYQADPHPYFGIMDIFCLVSANEGFGLVAAEAMMHSLPVIATKVGGLKDIVLDGETGYLVSPHSPEAIAEKIQELIDNPEQRKNMGMKGRERALTHYSAERYAKNVENLYLELLELKEIHV